MTRMNEPVLPELGEGVYIAPTAYVGGAVVIGARSTIMHHVVVRGDVAPIRIGQCVNVQDASVLHVRAGVPLIIEDDVSIGHRAVVHCKRVGRGALIGTGAIVLDDAEIGAGAIVAAGALVRPGIEVPPGTLVVGVPARVKRDVTDADREYMARVRESYLELNREHGQGKYPNVAG